MVEGGPNVDALFEFLYYAIGALGMQILVWGWVPILAIILIVAVITTAISFIAGPLGWVIGKLILVFRIVFRLAVLAGMIFGAFWLAKHFLL